MDFSICSRASLGRVDQDQEQEQEQPSQPHPPDIEVSDPLVRPLHPTAAADIFYGLKPGYQTLPGPLITFVLLLKLLFQLLLLLLLLFQLLF